MRHEMRKDAGGYPVVGVSTLQEAPTTLKRRPQHVADNGTVFAVLIRHGL
jgi:hypothetical protein